ncbi:unnamed protein product [Phyllotreta striolata]|uniref:Uncharacterized protein n=1 Tax=Phyllotreta striolata TaxID=444603 RepID=A0A9N9TMJ5_PHYSR|nr:unnamed protein product [Phyllotreta striolata]
MAAAKKVGLEVEIEKLRDQSLVVFRGLVDEAVQKMNKADEDLKKQMSEEMKKVQKDATALDTLCRDTQTKIGRFSQEALEGIEKTWSCVRDAIEQRYKEQSYVFGVRSGYIENFIGLSEIKIRDLLSTIQNHEAKRDKEVARSVYNFKKKVCEEKRTKEEQQQQ